MSDFTDKDILTNSRYAGLVRRYHAWAMINTQTIAEHSWQMWRVYRTIWETPSAAVSELIMCHDAGEIGTGDVPLYAKRDIPLLKQRMDIAEKRIRGDNGMEPKLVCSPREQWRVKATDLIEGLEYCLQEYHMGNSLAIPAHRNYILALLGHLSKPEANETDRVMVRAYVHRLELDSLRLTTTELTLLKEENLAS